MRAKPAMPAAVLSPRERQALGDCIQRGDAETGGYLGERARADVVAWVEGFMARWLRPPAHEVLAKAMAVERAEGR